MADEENLKEQPGPQPDPAPRMTEEAFVEELLALVKRAEDAGLSPIAIIARVYFRRGVGLLDNLLAGVENSIGSGSKKKG